MNNIYSAYSNKIGSDTASGCASGLASTLCCKNQSGLDALENFQPGDDSCTPKFASAFNGSYPSKASPDLDCSENNSNFKMILQKRKNEEAAKSQKCKVVIRASQEINEVAKPNSISDSKSLLEKITKKLNKEDYLNFKVALGNFHQAKKANDNEKKVKYYKILRSLFVNDLTFFAEIETFIRFTGVIKPSSSSSSAATLVGSDSPSQATKRKFDQCTSDK